MRMTWRACMAAVIGSAAVLAAPAWRQSLDFYVDRARDECMTTLPGCKSAAGNAQGMLVFPRVRAATGGDSTADGALLVSNGIQGYYRITAPVGAELGPGESFSEIFMFMTSAALESLQNSSGWNAEATVIDQGKGADVDAVVAASPVIAYVFGKGGLIGAFSLDGARITRM